MDDRGLEAPEEASEEVAAGRSGGVGFRPEWELTATPGWVPLGPPPEELVRPASRDEKRIIELTAEIRTQAAVISAANAKLVALVAEMKTYDGQLAGTWRQYVGWQAGLTAGGGIVGALGHRYLQETARSGSSPGRGVARCSSRFGRRRFVSHRPAGRRAMVHRSTRATQPGERPSRWDRYGSRC